MGKMTGFLEYPRIENSTENINDRLKSFEDFHLSLNTEKRREQGARCMDCGSPFCQSGMTLNGSVIGCPLHNLIPEFNDEIYRGHMGNALSRLLKTNNFPEFTGRVCPALCEKACICGLNDAPVTVRENELYIIEKAFESGIIKPRIPKKRSGKNVAVIGSGPAGLTVADQLNHRGHLVTVFEKASRPGGLLMYGIPNMKLPKEIINRRIELMESEGVKFVTGADIGRTVPAEDVENEFDAVVLCCGAREPRKLEAEGIENAEGVVFAVDFLTEVTKDLLSGKLPYHSSDMSGFNLDEPEKRQMSESEKIVRNKDVLIVGGGDTAVDCVATVLRLGAKSVHQIIRKPPLPKERTADNPWPEYPKVWTQDYGQKEAADVFGSDPRIFGTVIKKINVDENGNIRSVMTSPSKSKDDGEMKELSCGLLLLATGFSGCENYVPESFGIETDNKGNVKTDENSFVTTDNKVFVSGDMRSGQSLVVKAMEEGRKCAAEVDKFLMGYSTM